jgi:type IV secretory pathway TraG/TraD family ATPase VirD4
MGSEVMKSISDALDMHPLVVEDEQEDQLPAELVEAVEEIAELTQEEKDGEEDFAIARENIKHLLVKGDSALDDLLVIAKATEQPRAFEIVSTLIKTLTDSNKQLMDLHEKRRQLLPVVPQKKEEEKKTETPTTTNVFLGTTEDFLEALRQKKKEAEAITVQATVIKE